MSNPFTTDQIQQRFKSLPPDIQTAISSPETARRLEDIGRSRGLRIDGIGTLIEYSGLIMLGLIKSNEFVDHLSRHLSISKEQAESIAVEVDQQVFSRIRNSLREVQYHSTSEKRFEEQEDFTHQDGTSPVRDSMIKDIEQSAVSDTVSDEAPIAAPVANTMAAQDYDPGAFAASSQPTTPTTPLSVEPEIETDQAVKATPESSLDQYQEDGFEEIPVTINNTPASARETADTYNQGEDQAYDAVAQSVVDHMPGAVQDAYAAGQAAAPAVETTPAVIQDFKSRLEEKIASGGESHVNHDPYKESI